VKIYGDYTCIGSKSYGNCDGGFLMGIFRLIYRVFFGSYGTCDVEFAGNY
jgi:hypothetical protein